MHKAIEVLQKESKVSFTYFMLSLLAFYISSFLLVWIYYPGIIALVVNLVLLVFLVMFIMSGADILKKLYVPDLVAVTGQFADFSTYEQMPDLDKFSHRQEAQMQRQQLVDPAASPSKQETPSAFALFDLGLVAAVKNMLKK